MFLKLLLLCQGGILKSLLQFPFMHLAANEIDVSFQYRYANQVSSMPFRIEENGG
jgi:hypothetical protein